MNILICNAGSTSLKFKLWAMPALDVLAEGRVERVGSDSAIYAYRRGGFEARAEGLSIPDYTAGVRLFLDDLTDAAHGAISALDEIAALIHLFFEILGHVGGEIAVPQDRHAEQPAADQPQRRAEENKDRRGDPDQYFFHVITRNVSYHKTGSFTSFPKPIYYFTFVGYNNFVRNSSIHEVCYERHEKG